VRRREFITLIGGAVASPLVVARAQQPTGMRRIGVLMNLPADDAEGQARVAAFLNGLSEFGWKDGSNIHIDYRWGHPDPNRIRRDAADLIELKPDVILSSGSPTLAALQVATASIPIVFAQVVDPVGSGFVDSLARPGHNITGFSVFEYSFGGKWLELLKEIAPRTTRAAVLRDLATVSGSGQFGAIQAVAPRLGVELGAVGLGSAAQIEHGIETLAGLGNGGLIVTASTLAIDHRDLIIMLAARHRLPAVYPFRFFTTVGGLISYGSNSIDPFRRAAAYVDRILRGENTAGMPVEAPVKYELVVNVKAANAIGLSVPQSLLARADEVIE
jgi:putative tryptophan/tyrosine transport system substrate-binding protein